MLVLRSLILSALASAALFAAEVPLTAEPNADEVAMLEFLNRFRADPKADAERIVPANGGKHRVIPDSVDFAMFRTEMAGLAPAGPLVMNLKLLAAARKHSRYMILNGLTHFEEPGKPGFSGNSPTDRAKSSGYPGSSGTENAFRDAPDPWGCHSGFVVDFGAGPGGMQPGRGHRANMINPGLREIGLAAVPHDGRISVTHLLGTRGNTRMAGGVIYADRNGDGAFTAGEGLGGVAVQGSDGSSTRTWASGGYTLELKKDGAVSLRIERGGTRETKAFPAGKDNISYSWAVPQDGELAEADRLLAAVDKAKEPDTPARFAALVALHLGTSELWLDDARRKRITALTGDVAKQLDAAQTSTLAAIDDAGVRKIIADQAKPFRSTLAAPWFKGAETLATAGQSVTAAEKHKPVPAPALAQLIDSLAKAQTDAQGHDLRSRFAALQERAEALR